ncbi:hypothetical protein [Achromobacter sp.]|uniref:hypothetical protein n=1 Tax=Achromobacter sp. TaxID=134375 RepID=UPI0028A9A8DA|nr:hypothetical protein [Achromobacter sp.]
MSDKNESRDWELTCDHCDGSGHVFVERQVAERKSDVQEFKEECEECEGRGFRIAFQDIPGIADYVKWPIPAPSTLARQAHEYGSPADVASRIEKFLAVNVRQDSTTLLLYEAMKALRRPLPAAPGSTSSAPGDAQDERQDWMACEMRRRIVTDNLKLSAAEMRARENRCRIAYTQDYMGAPMRWLADVYAEAAAVLEAKNAALAAQVPHKGDAA